MNDVLWTGPPGRPRRYRVDATGGGPRHEPGGGVEGMVYRAVIDDPTSDDHGHVVALKLLLDCRPADLPAIEERLRLLTGIDAPDLMRVRGTFVGTALTDEVDPDPADVDICYVVADWIDGTSLDDAAHDHDVAWALAALGRIARSVERLHRMTGPGAPDGMVHRDLKPSNVRVRPDGSTVLVDYGLVRPAAHDASVVGTPGWLAPEVASGRPGGKPADVYGVGAIAHQLVTGSPPRRDGTLTAVDRLTGALRGFPLGDELAAHIGALLATDPEERPTDLAAWAAGLDQLLDGRPLPSADRARRRRRIGVTALAGAAVIAAVVAVTIGVTSDDGRVDVDGPDRAGAATAATTTTAGPTTTRPGWVCETEAKLPTGPVADAIRAEFATLDDVCAGTGDVLGDGVVLPLLDRAGEPVSALIASPTTPVVRLSTAQLASYRDIVGRGQAASAPGFGGFPTAVRTDSATGYGIVELSLGGLVIGPAEGAQSFWVPQQVRTLWESHGGLTGELGAPTSPVFPSGTTLRLEFERGWMDVVVKDGLGGGASYVPFDESSISIHLVDPTAELAALGDVADRVLRQSNGTSWYIDDALVRHWIPDGPTWGCLQANQKVVPVDAPGYALSALQVGDRARCRK